MTSSIAIRASPRSVIVSELKRGGGLRVRRLVSLCRSATESDGLIQLITDVTRPTKNMVEGRTVNYQMAGAEDDQQRLVRSQPGDDETVEKGGA